MGQQPNQYVYILYNKYCPFVYKIGYTTRTPEDRARELSKETGTPGNWEVGHKWCVEDGYWLEQRIFAKFKSYRISPRNEHFEFKGYSVEHVAKLISEFINLNGESPIEEARKAEKQRQIEKERAEQAKVDQQKQEARNFECNRLIKEIKQQVNMQIRNETPMFASQIKRQQIQDKYFKYQNLPFNLDRLRQLKNELTILDTSKVINSQQNPNDSISNFIWLCVGVMIVATIIFLAMDSSDPVKKSNPTEYLPPQAPTNTPPIQSQGEIALEESSNIIDSTVNYYGNQNNTEQNISQIYPYQESNKITIEPSKSYQFNQPIEQYLSLEDAKQAHFESILAKHPDAMDVIERSSFDTWLNNQPDYIKESYEYTLDRGTSSQVIEMIDHYKKDTGY